MKLLVKNNQVEKNKNTPQQQQQQQQLHCHWRKPNYLGLQPGTRLWLIGNWAAQAACVCATPCPLHSFSATTAGPQSQKAGDRWPRWTCSNPISCHSLHRTKTHTVLTILQSFIAVQLGELISQITFLDMESSQNCNLPFTLRWEEPKTGDGQDSGPQEEEVFQGSRTKDGNDWSKCQV